MSGCGTFPTCRGGPSMSVHRDRPEVSASTSRATSAASVDGLFLFEMSSVGTFETCAEVWERPVVRVDRKWLAHDRNDAIDPKERSSPSRRPRGFGPFCALSANPSQPLGCRPVLNFR